MFIARADHKKIFAPLGAKPERRLGAKNLNMPHSLKHFAPTVRGPRRLCTLLTLLAFMFSVVAFPGSAATQQQGSANSSQARRKKLREIAMERPVEVEGVDGSELGEPTLEDITEATAIVYGRIIDSRSFFGEASPVEYGENITTEYTVDVLRLVKDKTQDTLPSPERAQPASLSTPLKIARNGGAVFVNGHLAAVTVKGYESLNSGKQYLFFLFWSPDYKAYVLAYGISGVVMVNGDLSLTALGSSKELQSKLRSMNLESLINQIK
jgi:hypothetical protein